ncbi:hypothetical protein [Planotetraspora kaengkrachanensis]|uniref:DUF4386 family protein n=1 Tax=Planotetraspora kaengkrachanensis TaxID=575193 RepID=A0A8J3V6U6_9ACTN|nr:hypothetical protein [Planotetraspora kaengkrachanensis]GIG81357.1 hypothetical protein Pka01_44840 [Planotetraspora kaengkrachanensis]
MENESRTETASRAAATAAGRPLRDVRAFWRILLAVITPLPLFAQAVYQLLMPGPAGGDFASTLDMVGSAQGTVGALQWVGAVFTVTLIPATCTVAWVARRGAPRLATAGALLSILGFLASALLPNDHLIALVTLQGGIDQGAATALDQGLWANPVVSAASGLWILGLTVGLALVGAALWRSRVAPAWAGVALMIAGPTHPFIPGQVGSAAGLVVGAIGMAGAGVALLRMRDDEFDLPPGRRSS